MDAIRNRILSDLKGRSAFDNRYSWQHLYLASFWNWTAILGSFGAATLAAIGIAPAWFVAMTAAISGVAVLILQRFSFYRRSRFHRIMQVNVEKLIRAIEYEGADPREISKQYSELLIKMEPLYPGHNLEDFSEDMARKSE
jgi:hypothetical protein